VVHARAPVDSRRDGCIHALGARSAVHHEVLEDQHTCNRDHRTVRRIDGAVRRAAAAVFGFDPDGLLGTLVFEGSHVHASDSRCGTGNVFHIIVLLYLPCLATNEHMIGLFDSGLGGLTVVRRVRELLPHHDVVYLADQAHVPYGDRSPEELLHLMRLNVGWLDAQGVNAIVMACNTSCATAELNGYPKTHAPVLDLIESSAIAVHDAGFTRIGVIATTATVRTGAYARRIQALSPHVRVHEIAAPALVPLVEAGDIDGEAPRQAVREVCAQLPHDIEAVILACTHYPVLDEHFAAVLGSQIARIDPAIEQAGRTAALAAARSIPAGSGHVRYVTTGDVDAFRSNVRRIMNHDEAHCELHIHA